MTKENLLPNYPFPAGGECGELLRAIDWENTSLGPVAEWPSSLRTALHICLQAAFPVCIYAGPDHILFYNDAWAPIFGSRHPGALGQAAPQVWADAWPEIEPLLNEAAQGKSGQLNGLSVRDVAQEMSRFDVSFTPIYGDDGQLSGVFSTATKTAVTSAELSAHRKIAESEQRYINLLLQSPFAVAIFKGRDLVIALANESMKLVLGKGPDILNRPLFEVLPELQGSVFPRLLNDVFETGKPFIGESLPARLLRDGRLEDVFFNFVYQPYRELDGTVSGVTCIAYEVTEAVQARKRIEENENRMRLLFAQMPFSVIIYRGRDLRVELANDETLDMLGKTWEELANKSIAEIFPELVAAGRFNIHRRVFETGQREIVPAYPLKFTRQGVPFTKWYHTVYEPLFDAHGKVDGLVALGSDVSEQVLARRKTEESEQEKIGILNSLNAHIAVLNAKGEIIMVNEAWEKFALENGSNSLDGVGIGENYLEVLERAQGEYSDEAPYVHQGILRVLRGEIPLYGLEYPCHSPTNERWFLLQVSPLNNSGGGVVVSHINITERRQAEMKMRESEQRYRILSESLEQMVEARTRELAENNAALEKSNRDLEQFAHIASHDLQEPLRKIQTFTNLLQFRTNDRSDLERYARKIEESAARMSQLIHSVLNYSQVAQSQDLFEPTDLNAVLGRVRGDFELLIEEKNAVLEIAPLPVIPGIPLQLGQLFSNLLSNALKFSGPEPRIRISARMIPAGELTQMHRPDAARPYAHIVFEDNGIGFSQEYAERIFAIFQRLHDKQSYAGTGIGLALCKKIVDNHQGAISATGELGKGARFDIYLPAGEPV